MNRVPELPEMENYKILLSERLVGNTITEVVVTREKSINMAVEQFVKKVKGRTIIGIERRAKHLLFKLDSGQTLIVHLMLGGLMYVGSETDSPDRTKQVILSFGETKLFFIGLRLGYLHLLTENELSVEFSELGPEPLDQSFTMERFHQLIDKKRGVMKSTLVNQKFIAGIGNHYSDEICFDAQILPSRQANELTDEEINNLYNSIKSILKRGIDFGGYIELPVYKEDKKTGSYNHHAFVYDREGEPCPRCASPIIRAEISSRKSFYCEQCQH